MDELDMSKKALAEKAGIGTTTLYEMSSGQGNPTIKLMEAIATALEVPLPYLLERTDMDQEFLEELGLSEGFDGIAPGYERVCVILPKSQAFIAKKWAGTLRAKQKADSSTQQHRHTTR
jgi:transcriptional regulator with XRE-family HTH domain